MSHYETAPFLPAYGADKTQVSISGLSSGGFMTTQLHVAYSSRFIGAGILAAGPYFCAGSYETNTYLDNATTTCMNPLSNLRGPEGKRLHKVAQKFAKTKDQDGNPIAPIIDDLANLKNDRIYIATGKNDETVKSHVVKEVRVFYKAVGIPDENVMFVENKAGHAILTDYPYHHPCETTQPPFINNGGFFHSHALLRQIYERDGKPLNPPTQRYDCGHKTAKSQKDCGKIIYFNQHEFIKQQFLKNISKKDDPEYTIDERELKRVIQLTCMSEYGFAYIPPEADKGDCRVHIALHGCEQGYTEIGSDYYLNTGYNEMAATNNIIVLYPQVHKSDTEPYNPKGCWDFWGYSSPNSWEPNFYKKDALQMKAIIAMVDRLCTCKNSKNSNNTHAQKAS